MAAMGAEHLVGPSQCCTHANGRRFLADGKMHWAAHLLLSVALRHGLLDEAYAQHLTIELPKCYIRRAR